MNKLLSLLLCASLLCAPLCGCAGEPSPAAPGAPTATPGTPVTPTAAPSDTPEETDFTAAVDAQVFAATMACWINDFKAGNDPADSLLLWDMAGWYAARLCRTDGCDLLSRAQVEDFLRAVGDPEPGEAPESWLELGIVKRVRSSDGQELYDFEQHKTFMDNMLGVNTEVLVSALEGLSAESVAVYHHDNGETENRRYTFRFEENPGAESAFAYRLTGMEPHGPLLTGPLTFDLEQLLAANSLSNIFSIYPAISEYNPHYRGDETTWLIPRDENLVMLYLSEDYCSGNYRGCSFDRQKRSDGKTRAMIGELGVDDGSIAAQDDYLQRTFDGLLEMHFDYIDEDLIWTDCRFSPGVRAWIALDRGTLVLREARFAYLAGENPVTTHYRYDSPPQELDWLDSWDKPLRTLILHWENFEDGELKTWTETVRVPRDWEYLPYEGRWGNYTVYLDEGYTKPYIYPGDGQGYTLYLSTAKG